jgi:hypothetical protein
VNYPVGVNEDGQEVRSCRCKNCQIVERVARNLVTRAMFQGPPTPARNDRAIWNRALQVYPCCADSEAL